MRTLAPRNDPATHGVYVDALTEALDGEVDARNIALAGPYGVGNSSILRAIVVRYSQRRSRVVQLSLSTLGDSAIGGRPGRGRRRNDVDG